MSNNPSSNLPQPPQFPTSNLNPGPQTKDDWDQLIRWLLKLQRTFSALTQSTQSQFSFPAAIPYSLLHPSTQGVSLPHASVRMTTIGSLNIPSNGNRVPLTFDTKDVDSGNFWSAVSNTKLTAPASGDYYVFYSSPSQAVAQPNFGISAFATGAGVTAGSLGISPTYLQIRKNGNNVLVFAGTYAEGYFWTAPGGSTFTDIGAHGSGSAIVTLAQGDYVELVVWQNYSGGPTASYNYPPSTTVSQQPQFGIIGPLQ